MVSRRTRRIRALIVTALVILAESLFILTGIALAGGGILFLALGVSS